MPVVADRMRIRRIVERSLQQLRVDLSGLTVFTEAASGPYLPTPLMAALAGAARVYAKTTDSRFASGDHVAVETMQLAEAWGVADRIKILQERSLAAIAESDIITNTGFVRPIDRALIRVMKPTAVIPLMWETWEFRPEDIDLAACREHGILVLGTNEGHPSFNLYPSTGFLAMKLLFEMGLDGFGTRVILLGGQRGMGRAIANHFRALDMRVEWFADDESEVSSYFTLPSFFEKHGESYDVLFLAEHHRRNLLLGDAGLLTFDQILRVNPALQIAAMAGNIDVEGLRRSGLSYFPHDIRPVGFINYSGHNLGYQTVLALTAMGLKVGEAMARARLAGFTLREAANYALLNSPAMDFSDDTV